LLKRASLIITHAGLNTALEALSHGLPMVAIPITNDQPGVASRLAYLGAAEVVQPGKLSVPRLRAALEKVIGDSRYRETGQRLQREIEKLDGVARAADTVEEAFATRKPILRRG
jgi:zeaxanthin glucosyltransferase